MSRARYVAQAGMIAAVYAALTLGAMQLLSGLAWGPVQFRVSEAVTVLAAFTPAAVPGLTLGTVLANLFNLGVIGPLAWLDVIFGSLGSGIGALWTWRFRKNTPLALLGPVMWNALIVPAYLPLMLKGMGFYQIPILGIDFEGQWLAMYFFGVVSVGIGQAIVVYGLGWPLLSTLRRLGLGEYQAVGSATVHDAADSKRRIDGHDE